jgi:hypothetical protein
VKDSNLSCCAVTAVTSIPVLYEGNVSRSFASLRRAGIDNFFPALTQRYSEELVLLRPGALQDRLVSKKDRLSIDGSFHCCYGLRERGTSGDMHPSYGCGHCRLGTSRCD